MSGIINQRGFNRSGIIGPIAPAQPAFLVTPASSQDDISINTDTTIVFGTEVFDQGSNFASNTFTAPVTGKYQLSFAIRVDQIDSAATYYIVKIDTSNRDYECFQIDPRKLSADPDYWSFSGAVLADMDASDTAVIKIYQSSGTGQIDISTTSYFSGYLVC